MRSVDTQNHAVRVQSVLHRIAFPQELRVPREIDVLSRRGGQLPRSRTEPLRGSDRDGRLPEDDGRLRQQRRELLDHRIDVGQIRGEFPLLLGGCSDTDEVNVGEFGGLGVRRREPQRPAARLRSRTSVRPVRRTAPRRPRAWRAYRRRRRRRAPRDPVRPYTLRAWRPDIRFRTRRYDKSWQRPDLFYFVLD